MPDNFSFNARYGLFTYAQCGDLDPHDVCCHFTSLQAECIIGREHHSDGGTHLHVFADFGRKRRFRRATTFDVSGRHPNIVPSRGTPRGGYDYATKDGDIVGEDSSAHPVEMELSLLTKTRRWLNSCQLKTARSFGMLYDDWLLDYFYEISPVLTHMHVGDSGQQSRLMRRREAFASRLIQYLSSVNGDRTTLELIRE